MTPDGTLTLILAIAGTLIVGLAGLCTTLIVNGQKQTERHIGEKVQGTHNRLDGVSIRLHRLNNWCAYLAGKNGWELPPTFEGEK